jgi:hypothetical protein
MALASVHIANGTHRKVRFAVTLCATLGTVVPESVFTAFTVHAAGAGHTRALAGLCIALGVGRSDSTVALPATLTQAESPRVESASVAVGSLDSCILMAIHLLYQSSEFVPLQGVDIGTVQVCSGILPFHICRICILCNFSHRWHPRSTTPDSTHSAVRRCLPDKAHSLLSADCMSPRPEDRCFRYSYTSHTFRRVLWGRRNTPERIVHTVHRYSPLGRCTVPESHFR